MGKFFLLCVSHLLVAAISFMGGIYALPILMAPSAPNTSQLAQLEHDLRYSGEFTKDLAGSDFLHWGEGRLIITHSSIALKGELAPGPAYKLYLSPTFVETEADFLRNKASMVQVGDIKTFDNFLIRIPEGIQPDDYTSVIIWCESFNEFITAATYQ